jgi:hypothetical protein
LYSQTRRPKAPDKSGWHIDNREGTGNIPDPQQPTHSRTCKQHHNDQWTPVLSSEPESSDGPHLPVPEKSRRHHDGVVETKRSYTNIEPAVSNDENSHLTKVVVNKQWTACITPSLTNRSGGALVTQGSTHSKTRNRYLYDPQMAVPSFRPQPSRGLSDPMYGEPRGRPGDARYGGQMRINGENSRIPKEVVNERWTACCTPSLTNITGNSPVSQRPTHSKTHNEYLYDPQMAVGVGCVGTYSR